MTREARIPPPTTKISIIVVLIKDSKIDFLDLDQVTTICVQ